MFTVHHATADNPAHWFQLDPHRDEQAAIRRARNYALDHGGYVCVKNTSGRVVYGTDPAELQRHLAQLHVGCVGPSVRVAS